MIEILFNSFTKLLTINTNVVGGIAYIYKNRKFLTSLEKNGTTTSILLEDLEVGDTIYSNYFLNGEVSEYSNTITIQSENLDDLNNISFNRTIFSELFLKNNSELVEWRENLLNKLKVPGVILNRYLLSSSDTEDFEEFWSSVIEFLLFYTKLSKVVSQGLLGENSDIISTYLSQRGYFLSLDETNEELIDIQSNYYYEIAKRGTMLPFLEVQLNYLKQGEFLKLIRKDSFDEFLFNLYRDENFGWNLDNASPLYRGLTNESSLDKIIEEKLPYELVKLENGNIVVDSETSLVSTETIINKSIEISPFLEYNLELDITGVGQISIGLLSYDYSGRLIGSLRSTSTNSISTYFVEDLEVSRRIFVRGILYNSQRGQNQDLTLNIGIGNNLISNPNTFRVVPIIEVHSGEIEISSFKFTPLYTPYSRGFIQVNNFITSFYKNNSRLSREEVDYKTQKYLLPYHTHWVSIDTTKEYFSQFQCQDTEVPNWQNTGRFICDKKAGVNSGKFLREEYDVNFCTSKGVRWVDGGFDFEKCPYCLPNGVEVTVGVVTCDCLSVSVESFGCACNEVVVDTISCICNF